jgi:Ferritin-like domain
MQRHKGRTMRKTEAKVVPQESELMKRRSFVTKAGFLGLGAAAATLLASSPLRARGLAQPESGKLDNLSGDTAQEIFTAALIAEHLATTFYYNGLIGPVITDPNLAGTGGTATNVAPNGNLGNVDYLRAALSEEIAHADLLRSLIGGTSPSGDPVQTFYFPNGCFDTLKPFTQLLNALEMAFIGAYLNAVLEFSAMAADTKSGLAFQTNATGGQYTSPELEYFAEVASSIMGIEAEHRVLGRVISNTNPANQYKYEQTDNLISVYNGKHSAVAALSPFLGASSGFTAYSLQTALAGAPNVTIATFGGPPPPHSNVG